MTVLVAREIGGDTASTDQEIRPSHGTVPPAWKNQFGARSQAILALLSSEPPTPIGNLGAMPSHTVYLQSHLLKGKLKRRGGS